MTDPVTVITTIYNGSRFIDGFARNLVQTLRVQDRAILLDDGSNPPLVLPDILRSDARIKLITAKRLGRGAALNLAIGNCKTGLIAIQDIDDLSLPGRLDAQSDFLAARPDALLFTPAQSDRPVIRRKGSRQISPSRLFVSNPFHHSSLAFHRDIWVGAGSYDTNLPCCIDLDFYLRAACRAGASLWQLDAPFIARNLDPAERFYAAIPSDIYQATLQTVLDRYRADVGLSHWMILAMMRTKLGIARGTGG